MKSLQKTSSRLAIAAASGVMMMSTASAADLGGNCCADLEERVAELEATTVRKGNRVVSLTLSGHVNESVMYWDDGVNDGARVVTNGYSMSRFRMRGSAKLNAEWSAGFYLEFGVGRTGMSSNVNQETGNEFGGYNIGTRHEALYLKSTKWGTMWIGHTSSATDSMHEICVGCTITSSPEALDGFSGFYAAADGLYFGSAGGTNVTLGQLGVGQKGFYGGRRNLIRFISPTFWGFSYSSSWGDADDGNTDVGTSGDSHDYHYDVALRYAGEFYGFRVAAAGGYAMLSGGNDVDGDDNTKDSWLVTAAAQHIPTGLYMQGTYRWQDIGSCDAAETRCSTEDEAWSIQVGWGTKLNSLGKTSFWFQYGNYDNGSRAFGGATVSSVDADIYSFGINQQIDAAAAELYLTYWNVQTDLKNAVGTNITGDVDLEDFNQVIAGARIKF